MDFVMKFLDLFVIIFTDTVKETQKKFNLYLCLFDWILSFLDWCYGCPLFGSWLLGFSFVITNSFLLTS